MICKTCKEEIDIEDVCGKGCVYCSGYEKDFLKPPKDSMSCVRCNKEVVITHNDMCIDCYRQQK